jgi:hypothetical protein
MKDHLMVNVDDLIAPEPNEVTGAVKNTSSGEAIAHPPYMAHAILAMGESMVSEEEPLLQMVECRICQEEDSIKNLESPCACIGSLKVRIAPLFFFRILIDCYIPYLIIIKVPNVLPWAWFRWRARPWVIGTLDLFPA